MNTVDFRIAKEEYQDVSVSAACAPVNQRRSSHCSWTHLQNAFPRPPTQVSYVHPAPPAQQADTLTFKSLRCGHLKSDASFKMQAVTSPRATCQSYAAPQQADVQPANRIAGGVCRCERCPGGAQSGRSRCWGKKILMKLISRRHTHVGVEGQN